MTALLLVLAFSAAQPGVDSGCVVWGDPWTCVAWEGTVTWSSDDITDYGTLEIPSMLCPRGLPPVFDGEHWTCSDDVDDTDITDFVELDTLPSVDSDTYTYLPTDCLPGSLITVRDDGLLACSDAVGWSCSVAGSGVDVKVTTEKRAEALALAVAAAEQIAGSVTIECEEGR